MSRWVVVYRGFGGPGQGYQVVSRESYQSYPRYWQEAKAETDSLDIARAICEELVRVHGNTNVRMAR